MSFKLAQQKQSINQYLLMPVERVDSVGAQWILNASRIHVISSSLTSKNKVTRYNVIFYSNFYEQWGNGGGTAM